MGGSLAGTDSWFNNLASEVSAHYGVGLDGAIHQYVAVQDTAWANGILEPSNRWPSAYPGNPNRWSVSIETEDKGRGDMPVSAEQYAAVLALGRQLVHDHPSIRVLAAHRVISPRTRPHCPGARWIEAGHFARLAAALGLQALT